ncbi:MAG: hypothetical protein AUK37_08820 [Rhodobacterales bacterium CG2_30_65_12]|nr:MAG: hypothetical protein AUK37_08820 [Rhodobacterales bacterium CG2_30_65_12]
MFDTTKDLGPKGTLTDPRLWSRVRVAPLPVSRMKHEFPQTLAYQLDLPVFEARELIEEYRRFLYLSAITDAQRVAPEAVRKAWAMHAHSPDYSAFCAGALGKQLGLDDGTRKFGANAAYRRTLQSYVREFGTTPPPAIWPPAISPRIPRWLTAHAAVLGVTGLVAWERGEPLILAAGLGLSLVIYGLDVYAAHMSGERRGLGAAVSDDLDYFLVDTKNR